jgi:serine/threonine-protein kinase HipA
MRRCPITYKKIPDDARYSSGGLAKLSPRLGDLRDLPYTALEQERVAAERAGRMSIQGVQPKLSAKLSVPNESFEVVDTGGIFILKPQNHLYPQLPENEDLTMKMAAIIGIETPLHGLIYAKDGSLTYFIRRFDRLSRGRKLAMEDFAQLGGFSRDTKYDASMEQVAGLVERYATFPAVEKAHLFTRVLFNFLTGNDDMHLKNFSMIRRSNKVELAPAYDFLNTSLAVKTPEEMALPLHGKKNKLSYDDLVDYFGRERLRLTQQYIVSLYTTFRNAYPTWRSMIDSSFLAPALKERYHALLEEQMRRLHFSS